MSRDECVKGDWAGAGYSDGVDGLPASQMDARAKSCAEYHIAPDQTAYAQGRAKGLLAYCTPAGGWRAGVKGDSYQHVCSGPQEQNFLNAYHLGSEIAHARSAAKDAKLNEDNAQFTEQNDKNPAHRDANHDSVVVAHQNALQARDHAEMVTARNRQNYLQLFGAVPQ